MCSWLYKFNETFTEVVCAIGDLYLSCVSREKKYRLHPPKTGLLWSHSQLKQSCFSVKPLNKQSFLKLLVHVLSLNVLLLFNLHYITHCSPCSEFLAYLVCMTSCTLTSVPFWERCCRLARSTTGDLYTDKCTYSFKYLYKLFVQRINVTMVWILCADGFVAKFSYLPSSQNNVGE